MVPPEFRRALQKYAEAPVHHCLSTLQAENFKRREGDLGSDLAEQVRQQAASCPDCNKRLGRS